MEKRCSACGIVKPLTCFSPDKRRKDQHTSICKPCVCIRSRDYYQLYKEAIKNRTRVNYLAKREYYRELMRERNKNYYATHKDHYDNYRQNNKDKIHAYQRAYYQTHREQKLEYERLKRRKNPEYSKAYRESHRTKLAAYAMGRKFHEKTNGGVLTGYEFLKIIEAQDYKCSICGKRFTKTRKATVDHIIPVSEGGSASSVNIQALCLSCNSMKHDKILRGYIQAWGYPSLIYTTKSLEVSQST